MPSQRTICPSCKQRAVSRRQRKTWMRLLPYSKHFKCSECDARFLSIFGGIMRFPLTRLGETKGVVQTDLTFSTQSPGKERGLWSGKFRKSLTPVKVSLVILALGSFIVYQSFGGKAVREISRKFRQFVRLASTPQDGLVISKPKPAPEGKLVSNSSNRTDLPKPEEKKEAPAVLPDERKSPAANIPAEVAPSHEPESLAISTEPSQIIIKKGESLSRIIAKHYPTNQQIGLAAIMLANREISKNNMVYAGQILNLPQLYPADKIIKLSYNLYYGFYGSYYSDKDLKNHTLWLHKKNIKFLVINTQDVKKKDVQLVVLGGYDKKEDLKIILHGINTKSE